jgi:predicted GNAT family acetyltransferase
MNVPNPTGPPASLTGGEAAAESHLDNPIWHALNGPQAHFTRTLPSTNEALAYQPEVAPFAAIADSTNPAAWDQLHQLAQHTGPVAILTTEPSTLPRAWSLLAEIPGHQMVDTNVDIRAADAKAADVVSLGVDDMSEMTSLIERTNPGPFRARTVELGGYRGIRNGCGQLVAMAGWRVRPPGWIEISAVCTDPDHRGQGLARRVVRAVTQDIKATGSRAFLHVADNNHNAERLYRSTGFTTRRNVWFLVIAPK